MQFAVAHVVDDDSFGGVNRLLDFLQQEAGGAYHTIIRVKRGTLTSPKINADIIVSHLSASWKNLPLMTALRGEHAHTPMVHVEHSYSEHFAALNVTNRDRFDTLLRTIYALFDAVVAVSDAQASWLLRKDVLDPAVLNVINPCVDLAPFRAAGAARTPDRTIVGAIGRFDRQKGFDTLIKALAAMGASDLHLDLYGDGPERGALEALARDLPNVTFKGFASDPAAAIAACDIIAMPSRWEPYGLVALEAMAAGRTVLCPRADGLATHIANGAVEVGLNTVEGWHAALLDPRIWQTAPDPGRPAIAKAEERTRTAWSSLFSALLSEDARQAATAGR